MRKLHVAVVSITLITGCTGGITGLVVSPPDGSTTNVNGNDASSTSGVGGTPSGVPTSSLGIPCAVATVLQTRCQSCHSNPPANGAPMPLMTLADLRKTITDWVAAGAPVGIVCNAPTTGGTGGAGPATTSGSGGAPGTVGGGGATGTATVTPAGFPCDIQAILQNHCVGCHSNPPANGAPMPLTSYDFVIAKSPLYPDQTFAQRALVRVQNDAAPMPPIGNPRLSATEITALGAWVSSQYPKGTCGSTTGGGGATGTTTGTGGRTGSGGATGGGGSTGTTTTPPTGLPCDVQAVLVKDCLGCHSNPPTGGAPMSLAGYDFLVAKSFADPNATFAQRAISRMQNDAAPMPPAGNPRASASDIATITNWVNSMYPRGTCGSTTGVGGASGTGGATGTTGVGGRGGTTGTGGSTGTVATGIPCDIQALLQTRCQGCHTNPPLNGAPMPLLTYANLTAASLADPTMTFAQRALGRMQAGTMPPAPNALATAAEMTSMSNWIASMYPRGTCGTTTGGGGAGGATGAGGAAGRGGAGGAGGTGGSTAVGLPCDVQAVFTTHCTTCHAATPNSGAPMPLVTRANLTAPSLANAAQTFAQRAVMRMQGNPSFMPPAPGTPASTTEVTTVNNWIAAGYPAGTCGTTTNPPPPDPLTLGPRCTSGVTWNPNDAGSPIMNPGLSCLSCHTGAGGGGGDDSGGGGGNSGPGGGGGDDNGGGGAAAALYTIAGTVYPTGHEPDLCYGANGSNGALVVITDAANRTITLTPNQSGNFFYAGAVTFPVHAKVTYQGRERIMVAGQSNGSCNSCHTQNGASGAPGRITLP